MKGPRGKGPVDPEQALVEKRVREGIPIAEAVAKRMHHRLGGLLGADELLEIAQPALLDAARSHDPERAPFGPYLVMKLKWAMLDEARKLMRQQRLAARAAACSALERLAEADDEEPQKDGDAPSTEAEDQARLSDFLARRAAAMAVGLVSVSDTDRCAAEDENPEERLAREELRRILRGAVELLPERERALVERHYFADENFDAIAGDLGLSKSWASRLHARAMESLAGALRRAL
jgi:RNA polymerase sigma factor for flagellar operon FliA